MATDDLMGGYAVYTTPNAVLQEMAAAGNVSELPISVSYSYWPSLSVQGVSLNPSLPYAQ
ncbi:MULTISPECIES: hypothetical protein [unclassified Streptomyces]|uniref:hypothetical protein n=1 Tax=unclassified Streptomyces TaxID=2593676 RepID=UPI002E2CAB6E|nr:hypothetical protein [Streptomyces sp. NBC_00223]